MTPDRVRQVIEVYQQQLVSQGLTPLRHEANGVLPTQTVALRHVLWMLGEIRAMLDSEGSEGKVDRWLGFVQGVLWLTGRKTIDQMRDDNRS
jgi:hypothetical protein